MYFAPKDGYVFSPANIGDDDGADSDANTSTTLGVTGTTQVVNLNPGQANNTLDAGMYKTASLGNYVWLDIDKNGVQDGNEAGVNGVTVNLYDDAGNLISSTITGDDFSTDSDI
ncbi:SdrD B-like domain-containing protein, partial [Chromatium okenii]|uniref:SdrD B-like domain-containing protein n=1 Tax=Chromatium okenii TaxID=61644 RepID=UPI0026EA516F